MGQGGSICGHCPERGHSRLKELLALADPGVEVAGGMLVALAGPRMCAMCFNFQNCGSWALVA